MPATQPQADNGRDETLLERDDRNLNELLQEARVVQTGVQILFGFLLAAAFQPKFERLSSFQKADYFVTLVCAAATLIMLTAPTAWHRILFRHGDKEHLVEVSNRFHADRPHDDGADVDRGRVAAQRSRLLPAGDRGRHGGSGDCMLARLVRPPCGAAPRAQPDAGTAAPAPARRCLIRTASIRFWRTDSTRIEKPLAAIVSPRLGSRPSSANTNPPTEL